MNRSIDISVIIPVFNEEGNISLLCEQLKKVLKKTGQSFEMIFVDDGSIDNSYKILKGIDNKDRLVRVIGFLKNFGQTAAISAGVDKSLGRIIVTIDADLQNDPKDIPRFIEKIHDGYDVVCGWRERRHFESYWTRRIPSLLANKLISKIVGFELHDYGCTLKAYRREFIKPIKLYGEMHRFIPAYAFWYGAKITEIPISYRPRKFGKSKYNLTRTYKVILDLLTVKFLESFITKPIYVFGTLGLASFGGGVISVVLMFLNKLFRGISMIQSPLLLLSAIFVILGAMFVAIGLLAEIIVRVYYESQGKKTYIIKEN